MSAAIGGLSRVLARLVGFVLMLALAVGGLALAVFSIEGGESTLSLPGLAERLGLPAARDEVGAFLSRITDGGGTEVAALVGGAAAVLLGLLIAFGALSRRSEREFELDGVKDASASARAKAAAQAAELRVASVSGVSGAKTKARLSKRRRRLDVAITTAADAEPEAVRERAVSALEPLGEELGAAIRVRAKAGDLPEKARVQ